MAKSFWSEKDQRLVSLKQSNPRTEFDTLAFPGNRPIAQIESAELVRLLQSFGIAGVSPSNSRERNLAAYAYHLNAIGKQASDAAIAAWVRSKN